MSAGTDYERLRQLAERVEAVCEPGPTTPGGVAELARGVLVLLAELVAIRAAGKEWKVCWEAAMARAEQAEAALVAVREERDALAVDLKAVTASRDYLVERCNAAERERDTLREAALEAEAELRARAAVTNAIGQIEPPYTAASLLSMANMLRAALSTVDTPQGENLGGTA